jgi:hypothetical protein
MDLGMKEALDLGKRQRRELLGDLTDRRNLHADEEIPFTVLAWAGLEKAGEDGGLFRAGEGSKASLDFFGGHRASVLSPGSDSLGLTPYFF